MRDWENKRAVDRIYRQSEHGRELNMLANRRFRSRRRFENDQNPRKWAARIFAAFGLVYQGVTKFGLENV